MMQCAKKEIEILNLSNKKVQDAVKFSKNKFKYYNTKENYKEIINLIREMRSEK